MQAVTEILAILMVYYDIRDVLRRLIPGSPRERLITLSVLKEPRLLFLLAVIWPPCCRR